MSGRVTPSQTVGPFFSIGFSWMEHRDLTGGAKDGVRVRIRGRVFDGDGQPVPDALLEIWQADAQGKYGRSEENAPGTAAIPIGFGRVSTDGDGHFQFTTVKPDRVGSPQNQEQAPHLEISLFMRGLLRRLVTRLYFPDDPANAADPVLALVPAERREALIARPCPGEAETLVWDVHLQGQQETVFFDY